MPVPLRIYVRKNLCFQRHEQAYFQSKEEKGEGGYGYKARAIAAAAADLVAALREYGDWIKTVTLVPVPPSKVRGDPEYDDRVLRVCGAIQDAMGCDVREVVVQTKSTVAAHKSGSKRPTVEELLEIYATDVRLLQPAPKQLVIVDDVLTAGTHFRAVQLKLSEIFSNVPILGIFLARRIFSNDRAQVDFFGI